MIIFTPEVLLVWQVLQWIADRAMAAPENPFNKAVISGSLRPHSAARSFARSTGQVVRPV